MVIDEASKTKQAKIKPNVKQNKATQKNEQKQKTNAVAV